MGAKSLHRGPSERLKPIVTETGVQKWAPIFQRMRTWFWEAMDIGCQLHCQAWLLPLTHFELYSVFINLCVPPLLTHQKDVGLLKDLKRLHLNMKVLA